MYKDLKTITTNSTNINAIKNSIRNILLTRRGSLPGKPKFGSDIYKIIFSPLDSLTEIMAKNFIYEALSEYEDRINISQIKFTRVEEYNKLVIDILFTYRDDNFSLEEIEESISLSLGY